MTAPVNIKELALVAKVRGQIAQGAPIKELALEDMPVWLFRRIDHRQAVGHTFISREAALVVYTDGSRLLARIPAQLRNLAA